MRILVFAAHPDDETLGCGGTILSHVNRGDEVYICIVTNAIKSFNLTQEEARKRREDAERSCNSLSSKKTFFLDQPSVLLDTVPLLDLVKQFTEIVTEVKPDIIYTHFENDLNQDHRIVNRATLIASRSNEIKEIYFYEIPSTTNHVLGIVNQFAPNTFVDISEHLDKKLEILSGYESEMKEYPDPRSLEGIKLYAKFRGLMCNLTAAEAFVLYREIK